MSTPQANTNIHLLAGNSVQERADERYRAYRRQWTQNPETGTVADYPLFLDLEATSNCNLRCPFCATTYRGPLISRGYMDEGMLRRIIDEGAAHGLYGVKFNIRGEPLLHPAIDRFVAYAKQRGLLDVYFNTNAMLLTREMSRKLIHAGLDRISVSIEGHTPEVYEKYRVGGDLATVIANLEQLRAERERQGVKHPAIRIQSVLIPELRDIMAAYRDFWQSRAEEVSYLDYKKMQERRCGVVDPWACPQLWQRLAVWWDGTVLPCNHDDGALLRLGDAHTDTLRDCWHSPALQRLRAVHRAGQAHTVPACDGCYIRDSEITAKIVPGGGHAATT